MPDYLPRYCANHRYADIFAVLIQTLFSTKEYIHRVGRTARGLNGRGHALLILRPEELGFLRYLKQSKVKDQKNLTSIWPVVCPRRQEFGSVRTVYGDFGMSGPGYENRKNFLYGPNYIAWHYAMCPSPPMFPQSTSLLPASHLFIQLLSHLPHLEPEGSPVIPISCSLSDLFCLHSPLLQLVVGNS